MTAALSPTPNNLLIGAGMMLMNPFDGAGNPTDWFHFGNIESAEIRTEDTVQEKYSSMESARGLYASRLQRRLVTLTVLLNEYSKENLRLLTMGSLTTWSQTATPVVGEVLSAAPVVGKFYKVAAFGPIASVSVEMDGGAGTALTAGTHYILYAQHGLIQFLSANSGTGNLAIDYTPVAVTSGDRIQGATASQIEGKILFLPDPTTGPKLQTEVHKVSVNPDGVIGLISEDYAGTSLSMKVQADSVGHPTSPYYTQTILP